MTYEWKEGTRFPIPAKVAGETLAKLEKKHKGGVLPPEVVVDHARPEKSPIHPCFEWDDAVAAEKHRIDQARQLVRCIRVVHPGAEDEEPKAVICYASVTVPDVGKGYVSTARILGDEDLKQQMLDDAIRQIEGWRQRFASLSELQSVFDAIDAIRAAAATN